MKFQCLHYRAAIIAVCVSALLSGVAVAAPLDLAADYAIAARLGRGVPTVDLRTDFHQPARPVPLLAKAAIVKLGRTLATAEARVHDSSGAIIASGRGVYATMLR